MKTHSPCRSYHINGRNSFEFYFYNESQSKIEHRKFITDWNGPEIS